MIKAFVISYNRLTLLKNICDELLKRNCEPIIVDNNSDYPPLLEWLDKCPYIVERLKTNGGHLAVWESGVIQKYSNNARYIVTDPDLDISGVPLDMLEVLNGGLNRYKIFNKCGLSLNIDNLPDREIINEVRRAEGRYWRKRLDPMYFDAPVDTTLAIYREGYNTHTYESLRTDKPYCAEHLPWYYDKLADLPEDEQYYFTTANNSSSGKHRIK